MNQCGVRTPKLMEYLSGELSGKEFHDLELHIKTCSGCRKEVEELDFVFQAVREYREDVEQELNRVNWQEMPEKIALSVFDSISYPGKKQPRRTFFQNLLQPRWLPVYAALLVGVILGGLLAGIFFQSQSKAVPIEEGVMISGGSLAGMDQEVSRRETLDFLEKSRYLLLDFLQTPTDQVAENWNADFMTMKTGDLLSKKKMINTQLDSQKMAKAKVICDQIEMLFIELTQINSELSSLELERVRAFIEDRQILLRIKLVKEELEHGEV